MSMSRIAALLAGLSLVATFASAASRNNTMRIKVLDSETRSLGSDGNNGVPLDCDQLTFDAYCRSTRGATLVNTLVVQAGDGPPFRISCTAESRFSKCTPLPRGEDFEARREKKGVTVYYVDNRGKLISEFYKLVGGDAKDKSVEVPANSGPAGVAAASPGSAPDTEPAPPLDIATESSSRETTKCSFSSTPAGAEVTVDGRYVGSTPSVLGLATGTHVVVVTMNGFAEWKRQLEVSPGSELTVNAVLQKK